LGNGGEKSEMTKQNLSEKQIASLWAHAGEKVAENVRTTVVAKDVKQALCQADRLMGLGAKAANWGFMGIENACLETTKAIGKVASDELSKPNAYSKGDIKTQDENDVLMDIAAEMRGEGKIVPSDLKKKILFPKSHELDVARKKRKPLPDRPPKKPK